MPNGLAGLVLAFVIGLLTPTSCWSGDYGYLRITVKQVNPNHRTNVRLKVNGRDFVAFSHALSAAIVKELPSDLLAKGKSTPLSSDYGGLQNGCEFAFNIEYSLEQRTWVLLGTFQAPTVTVNSAIPIGLCDGSVCSSNPAVARSIEEVKQQRWKEAKEAIRKWLQDGEDGEAMRLEAERKRLVAEVDRPPAVGTTSAELDRTDQDIAFLQDTTEMLGQTSLDPETNLAQKIDEAVRAGGVDNLMRQLSVEEAFYRSCLNLGPRSQAYCQEYGSAAWVVATADSLAVAMSADPEKAAADINRRMIDPSVTGKLESKVALIAKSKFLVQSALDAKRAEEIRQQISDTVRLGVSFSPLNDVMDLCEAISGKEFCVPDGRDLLPTQRFMAVMGVIGGNRLIWDQMAHEAKLAIFAGFKNPGAVERAAEKIAAVSGEVRPKAVGHILFGEFDRDGAFTKIRSGMHTEDAVAALQTQWREEGLAVGVRNVESLNGFPRSLPTGSSILRYEASDGVILYQFPRDRFADRAAFQSNLAAISVDGQKTFLQGAKTVFPKHWTLDTTIDSMVHSKTAPPISPGGVFHRGEYQGVEVMVRVDEDKRIVSGFPTIK